ncbi:MAG: hypothetical protein GY863_15425 [bacterium]|nr:hypothetical protein [bacterium]
MKFEKSGFRLIIIVAVILVFTGSALPQSSKYEGILGTWDVETDGGEYTFVFDFKMDGDSLVGTFERSSGESTPMEDLIFENNELIFSVSVEMGTQSMLFDYTAEIEGEELSGELSMEYGTASITGIRRKK